MCALLCPDVGEVAILDFIFKTTTPETQKLKLYLNDISPAESDTAGTYTEATISGYALVSLVRATWNGASTSVGISTNTYPAQTFSFTGTGTIVGYYVVGATSSTLLFAERLFSTPGQVFNNGDSLVLSLKVGLD